MHCQYGKSNRIRSSNSVQCLMTEYRDVLSKLYSLKPEVKLPKNVPEYFNEILYSAFELNCNFKRLLSSKSNHLFSYSMKVPEYSTTDLTYLEITATSLLKLITDLKQDVLFWEHNAFSHHSLLQTKYSICELEMKLNYLLQTVYMSRRNLTVKNEHVRHHRGKSEHDFKYKESFNVDRNCRTRLNTVSNKKFGQMIAKDCPPKKCSHQINKCCLKKTPNRNDNQNREQNWAKCSVYNVNECYNKPNHKIYTQKNLPYQKMHTKANSSNHYNKHQVLSHSQNGNNTLQFEELQNENTPQASINQSLYLNYNTVYQPIDKSCKPFKHNDELKLQKESFNEMKTNNKRVQRRRKRTRAGRDSGQCSSPVRKCVLQHSHYNQHNSSRNSKGTESNRSELKGESDNSLQTEFKALTDHNGSGLPRRSRCSQFANEHRLVSGGNRNMFRINRSSPKHQMIRRRSPKRKRLSYVRRMPSRFSIDSSRTNRKRTKIRRVSRPRRRIVRRTIRSRGPENIYRREIQNDSECEDSSLMWQRPLQDFVSDPIDNCYNDECSLCFPSPFIENINCQPIPDTCYPTNPRFSCYDCRNDCNLECVDYPNCCVYPVQTENHFIEFEQPRKKRITLVRTKSRKTIFLKSPVTMKKQGKPKYFKFYRESSEQVITVPSKKSSVVTISQGTITESVPAVDMETSTFEIIKAVKAVGTDSLKVRTREIGVGVDLQKRPKQVTSKHTNTDVSVNRTIGTDARPLSVNEKVKMINKSTDPIKLKKVNQETNTTPVENDKSKVVINKGTDPIRKELLSRYTNTTPMKETSKQKASNVSKGTQISPINTEDKNTSYDKVETREEGTDPLRTKKADKQQQFDYIESKIIPSVAKLTNQDISHKHVLEKQKSQRLQTLSKQLMNYQEVLSKQNMDGMQMIDKEPVNNLQTLTQQPVEHLQTRKNPNAIEYIQKTTKTRNDYLQSASKQSVRHLQTLEKQPVQHLQYLSKQPQDHLQTMSEPRVNQMQTASKQPIGYRADASKQPVGQLQTTQKQKDKIWKQTMDRQPKTPLQITSEQPEGYEQILLRQPENYLQSLKKQKDENKQLLEKTQKPPLQQVTKQQAKYLHTLRKQHFHHQENLKSQKPGYTLTYDPEPPKGHAGVKLIRRSKSEDFIILTDPPRVQTENGIILTNSPSDLSMHLTINKVHEEVYRKRCRICKCAKQCKCKCCNWRTKRRKLVVCEKKKSNTIRITNRSDCQIDLKDGEEIASDLDLEVNFNVASSCSNVGLTNEVKNMERSEDETINQANRFQRTLKGNEEHYPNAYCRY